MGAWSFLGRWRRGRADADPAAPVPVVLYTRPGCTLCEELVEALEAARPRLAWRLERVDVDGDPALRATYGERIPVMLVGGRLAFAGRVRRETVGPRFLKLARRWRREGPGRVGPPGAPPAE